AASIPKLVMLPRLVFQVRTRRCAYRCAAAGIYCLAIMVETADIGGIGGTQAAPLIHPLHVRITHWINALAILIMIGSGWQIYNASPLFAFTFPNGITLGGWLAGGLLWHFAAMWLLIANGLVYVSLGLVTGRFRHQLL